MMRQPEAVLDFGTSKIACLLGNIEGEDNFEVYGIGSCDYKGIKKGRFLDDTSLPYAIKKTIDIAQSEATRRIKEVYIGVPGSFCEIECSQAELDYGDKPGVISEADIDLLIEESFKRLELSEQEGLLYIQSMPMHFRVDGNARKDVPIGSQAKELWGAVSHIFAYKQFVTHVEDLLADIGIGIAGFIYSTYAEGMLLIPKENATEDAIVLDVGYLESDICAFRNGVPVFKKTLAIGGVHFASDISYVLQIAPDVAETIKRRHVFGLDYTGRTDVFRTTEGKMEEFVYEHIQDIIEARLKEFAQIVAETIENAPITIKQDADIYVCGGGLSMMRGSKEFFQAQTGYSIKYESPWLPRMNSSSYYSTYGVLNYIFKSGMKKEAFSAGLKSSTLVKALINFFTK